ncbi:MAG: redoxin domain-containing protein [Natronomonas sp.]
MSPDFDVVELGPADSPSVGETAPDFTRPLVNDEYWEDTSLSELLDSGPLVLLFHTMDGDFPATYIWQEIRDRAWAETIDVVGLSISSPYEHKRFIDDHDLEDYRLFSDPKNLIAEQYGIAHDLDGMEGISEPRPAAFVLDTDGTIEYAWVSTEWPEFPPYDEIEASIDEL